MKLKTAQTPLTYPEEHRQTYPGHTTVTIVMFTEEPLTGPWPLTPGYNAVITVVS